MKKLFFICMLFLLGMACSNEEIVPPEAPQKTEFQKPQTPEQFQVTTEDALTRAEKILSQHQTRSTPRVVKSCEYYVAKPATRSLADTVEVAFHLINYEDNAGFAMVAADERATDIYAYSDEGQLNPEDLEDNPGLNLYMDMAVDYYSAEVLGLIAPPDNPFPEDPITPVTPIAPPDVIRLPTELLDGKLYFCKTEEFLVSTDPMTPFYWDQFWPYNYYCAPNVTGCGPTAMGKIMAYHKHPDSFNGVTFNWDIITANERHINLSDTTRMISRLVCEIGSNHPGINYGESTGTNRHESRQTFINFGYSCSEVINFSNILVESNIEASKPIWVRGTNTFEKGHAWVIDAYEKRKTRKTYYETLSPYNLYKTKVYTNQTYYRCIWGWKNTYSTYCLVFDFEGYDTDVQMICGITPLS